MWRICSDNGWFSTFCKKKRGKKGKTGPPAHDDLVNRQFTATGPNDLWLAHITEHGTDEGMLYLCAIKDVWSNRIVGYSISDRIKSSTAVAALDSAVARRGSLPGCILHSDRGRSSAAATHLRARRWMGPSRSHVGASPSGGPSPSYDATSGALPTSMPTMSRRRRRAAATTSA